MASVEMKIWTRDLLAPHVQELMRKMRDEGRYFVPLPPGEGAEAKYAGERHVDPDGRERDILAERERYLEDNGAEVRWLRAAIGSLRFGDDARARSVPVLDVGCGYGRMLSELRRWGANCYGIEPSEHQAKHAREHGTIHVGTIETIPETWRDFDVAILAHVIDHMTDPVGTMRRVYELLRPGGRLLVTAEDFDSPSARIYRERYRMLADPTHVSLFSTESLLRCLRDIGFEVERIDFPLPARLDTEEAREAAKRAGVSPPARGNVVSMYARRP